MVICMIPTISWIKNSVRIIDQIQLPTRCRYLYCRDVASLWQAIRRLSVRGAPAIGIAAAFGVLLGIKDTRTQNRVVFQKQLARLCDYLASSRPTAVNLFYALERMQAVLARYPQASVPALKDFLRREAFAIFEEDRLVCRRLGAFGAPLIQSGQSILTICNAGALATADYGTALGVLYAAREQGKSFKVFACETRPLLQGARLTAWELLRAGIDTTLICDSMAAKVMRLKKVSLVIAGADRIALNGDTANKIGTYSLAVLAKYHRIPFFIAAPLSTFDPKIQSGVQIPIEERSASEVTSFAGTRTAPKNVKVFNPAFDVTDHALISGIITEYGVLKPPFAAKIRALFKENSKSA